MGKSIRFLAILTYFIFVANIAGMADNPVPYDRYMLYSIKTFGSVASNGLTPFWIAGNQYGIVPLEANNAYLQATAQYRSHDIKNGFIWNAKVNVAASTSRYRNIFIQELYAELSYKELINLSIGSREGINEFQPSMNEMYKTATQSEEILSYNQSLLDPRLSSGDLGLSSNARPIPEINLYIPRFLIIPKTGGWLQAKGNFAIGRSFDSDYLKKFSKADQYYVQNVLWHHKSLYLQIKDTRNSFPLSFTVGVRHFAQWGGTSTNPQLGKQPQSVKDFSRIVMGKSGGSDASSSDQINVLGNHYGTYDLFLNYRTSALCLSAYYQQFWEDRSGIEWYNKWDGLKGLQINLPKFPWVSNIVIEYLTTMKQSGPFHFIEYDHSQHSGYGGGADNYYNNGEYTTGASYFNRSLGSPLLISPEYNENGALGFKHNRIQAWHLATDGEIVSNLRYCFKLSTIKSYGTAYMPTLAKLKNTSILFDIRYQLPKQQHNIWLSDWEFGASVGIDRGELLGNHLGASLSICKRGVIFW